MPLRSALAALLLVVAATACAQGPGPTYQVSEPSYHSAGPGAEEEIQAVLDSQAANIGRGDWRGLLGLFIPTERSRCPLARFAETADENFGELREKSNGSKISARMADLEVNGFRASVEYQFVLPTQGLASPAQTAHYLKLGDEWFIDEKAC